MKKKVKYGIFGNCEVEYDENGFTEVLAVIQDSGLYFGASPKEIAICCTLRLDDLDFARRYVAKLNRHTDLLYRLYRVKVKVANCGEIIKDDDLSKYNLKPLEEELE